MKLETGHLRDIAGVFDRAAGNYDSVGPPFFSYFGSLLVKLSGIPPGAAVLDAGTGKGAVLFPAARKVGPNGKVVGIDISGNMARQTKKKAIDADLKNINVLRMDAAALSFTKNCFDYVLCGFSLLFCSRPFHVLQEFKRVLRENGTIGITCRAIDRESHWFGQLIEKFVPLDAIAGQDKKRKIDSPGLHTPGGVESMLKTAGFINIRVFEITEHFVYRNPEEWWQSQWTNGRRRILEAVCPENMDQLKTQMFKRLSLFRERDAIRIPCRVIAALGDNSCYRKIKNGFYSVPKKGGPDRANQEEL